MFPTKTTRKSIKDHTRPPKSHPYSCVTVFNRISSKQLYSQRLNPHMPINSQLTNQSFFKPRMQLFGECGKIEEVDSSDASSSLNNSLPSLHIASTTRLMHPHQDLQRPKILKSSTRNNKKAPTQNKIISIAEILPHINIKAFNCTDKKRIFYQSTMKMIKSIMGPQLNSKKFPKIS